MKVLRNICFPVYPIPNRGTIWWDNTTLKFRPKRGANEYLIDDSSIAGNFSSRRIVLSESLLENEKILPLKKAILTLGNLILFASLYSHFIDSMGKLFKYKREVRAPVVKRKIVTAIPYKSGTVLYMEDTHCPILFYRPIKPEEKFAVLVLINKGYIMLGVSTNDYLRRNKIKI